jgi:hypothetical protein
LLHLVVGGCGNHKETRLLWGQSHHRQTWTPQGRTACAAPGIGGERELPGAGAWPILSQTSPHFLLVKLGDLHDSRRRKCRYLVKVAAFPQGNQ